MKENEARSAFNRNRANRDPRRCLPRRRYSYAGVVGIPGFWQDANGIVQLWKPREYKMPMLVIPYKDDRGCV